VKYYIDPALCTGRAVCEALAPDVYETDTDGYNAHQGSMIDVPTGAEDAARDGAAGCPEAAIRVVE
jgi:ferredoxin